MKPLARSVRPGNPTGVTIRAVFAVLVAVVAAVSAPTEASAQVDVRDLVVTGGVAAEGYRGNLAAVTVPLVDSTDRAAAAVGQFGARGEIFLSGDDTREYLLDFDLGIRQSASAGFEVRDYAPREWVGTVDLGLRQQVQGIGVLRAGIGARGRRVEDRPPMPLFIQPGYGALSGSVAMAFLPVSGIRFDARVGAETHDYRSPDLLPQLDLLDRRSLSAEVGAEWGGQSSLRLFGAFRATEFPRQGSFDPSDPHRQDRTFRTGATWTLRTDVLAQLGVEAMINRSNSDRPEYDAVSVEGLVSFPLPAELSLDIYGVVTAKSYVHPTEFARLVPGEEADNASIVYASLTRPLAPNLDAAFRLGWARAETDIGDSYFQRLGATFLLNYRPLAR